MSHQREHWKRIYTEKAPDAVSWFEAVPRASLAMIDELALPRDAPIADVGGGASHLAAELVDRGYTDVTVADISGEALERARDGFAAADRVTWVIADVRAHDFGRRFRLWIAPCSSSWSPPRTVAPTWRLSSAASIPGVTRSLRPRAERPDPLQRPAGGPYGPRQLAAELGAGLDLVSSREVVHTTPAGTAQQFIYARLRRSQTERVELRRSMEA